MEKKFTRIFLIVVMAFAVCAFVSMEDVRESDAVYSHSEMLKESGLEFRGHYNVKEIAVRVFPLRAQTAAFVDGETPSPILLSLKTCILRC